MNQNTVQKEHIIEDGRWWVWNSFLNDYVTYDKSTNEFVTRNNKEIFFGGKKN